METSEPKMTLKCNNNYISEMFCQLFPDEQFNCMDYKMNMSIYKVDILFACSFNSTCQCVINVPGFTIMEIFIANVMRHGKVLLTEYIYTEHTVKPNAPVITSIERKERGNFYVTWKTDYSTAFSFSKELIPEVTYSLKGSTQNRIVNLSAGDLTYELMGKDLHPNSNYTLKVRIKYKVNGTFSDYSEPKWFTTSSSSVDNLVIIIAVICVILLLLISTIFYLYNRILKVCWEKVPTPKLAANFVKQVPLLLTSKYEFSIASVDSFNQKPTCKKIRNEDCETALGLFGVQKYNDPADVEISAPEYECVMANSQSEQWEVEDIAQSSGTSCMNMEDSSASGFSNMSYSLLKNPAEESYSTEDLSNFSNLNENPFSECSKPMDSESAYGFCNATISSSPTGFSETDIANNPIANDYSNNELVMEKLQDASVDKIQSIAVDFEYQDFHIWDMVPKLE